MKTFARVLLLLSAILWAVAPALSEPEVPSQPPPSASLVDAPNIKVTLWGLPIANARMQFQHLSPQDRAARIARQVSEIPVAAEYDIQIVPASEGKYEGAWVRFIGGVTVVSIIGLQCVNLFQGGTISKIEKAAN